MALQGTKWSAATHRKYAATMKRKARERKAAKALGELAASQHKLRDKVKKFKSPNDRRRQQRLEASGYFEPPPVVEPDRMQTYHVDIGNVEVEPASRGGVPQKVAFHKLLDVFVADMVEEPIGALVNMTRDERSLAKLRQAQQFLGGILEAHRIGGNAP